MSDQDTALQDALACVRVSPDDFDVFDVLGLGKEQAGDAGTGTASADTDSTDTASADTDDSADAR